MANTWQTPEEFSADLKKIMIESGVLNKDGTAKYQITPLIKNGNLKYIVEELKIKSKNQK